MCTAVSCVAGDHYFGRTLDLEFSYGEEIVKAPRGFGFGSGKARYAIMGVAHVAKGYPLFYDGVNECGLAMAGLNFAGFAHYVERIEGRCNIAHYELLPWVLGQCATVDEAEELLAETNITPERYGDYPVAELHWMIADGKRAVTVEQTAVGLRVIENTVGVLTNPPDFAAQMLKLSDHMQISAQEPVCRFADGVRLTPYSRGMGAIGLPGDNSSGSRFVRAAFTKLNAVFGDTEEERVGQFFHIMDAVAQVQGCNRLRDGANVRTVYTTCCNADKGIYYFTTYGSRRIRAVDMHRADVEGMGIARYPMFEGEKIEFIN